MHHGLGGLLGRPHRYPDVARLFFLFMLLGEDRLQHIARFGDVRQVDLRDKGLFPMARARGTAPVLGLMGLLSQPCANLFRLIPFKRAGVSLPPADTKLG